MISVLGCWSGCSTKSSDRADHRQKAKSHKNKSMPTVARSFRGQQLLGPQINAMTRQMNMGMLILICIDFLWE
jgi:hypothetical protein